MSAIVVVPTPPFGAKTVISRELPVAWVSWNRRLHAVDPADQVVAGERHRQDRVDALFSGSGSIGFWGTVRTITGTPCPGGVELADQGRALDPALEERVDDDDVGSELGDLGRHLRAIGHDVEQLDLLLRVQQAPDVLTDLRDILDDEQADLIGGGHRADYTKPTSRTDSYPEVMGRPGARGRRARPAGS